MSDREAALPTRSNPLATEVYALGTSRYSDVYGGLQPAATDTLHIFVVESSNRVSRFVEEIERLATELGRKFVVSRVAHTWQELALMTPTIGETRRLLDNAGITPVAWVLIPMNPDAHSDRIRTAGPIESGHGAPEAA